MEIERKYLVRELPADIDSHPHVEIEQGYLCTSPTLRIRRMGDAYILTVKEKQRNASSAIVNREEEFALTADKYNLLKAKCDGFLVSKTRYLWRWSSPRWQRPMLSHHRRGSATT